MVENKVLFYSFDCLDASEDALDKFLHKIKMEKTSTVILYEEVSAKNFSLFYMLCKHRKGSMEGVKYFCYTENDEIHNIIEDYYDRLEEKPDLEVFNTYELRARNVLKEHSIHSYYKENTELPLEAWNVHMLILGFGSLGQHLLLQAMNQGVIHSKNEILFDVVDSNVEEQKKIFANHFSSGYVIMHENEWEIQKADGILKIRFHQMDTRYKDFSGLLEELSRNSLFTYVVVCIGSEKKSLSCMLEVERFLKKKNLTEVPIGVRMDYDEQMVEYLTQNDSTHKNVFIIQGAKNAVSLEEMLSENLNEEAKEYHKLYQQIQVICSENLNVQKKADDSEIITWEGLKLYKRDSNRALSCHSEIKNKILEYQNMDKNQISERYLGKGKLLEKKNTVFTFRGSEEEFLQEINQDAFLKEMAMMEHRRWCYYMASRGWKYTSGEKEEELKKTPYLIDWAGLCQESADVCKYDLLPMLLLLDEQYKNESK